MRVKSEKLKVKNIFLIDLIDVFILILIGIGITLFFYRPWMTTTGLVLGFKYDFIPLIAFLVLRRVQWSDQFRARAEGALLWVAGIVALYGILTVFAPKGYFRLLGYSDAHSLYLPNGPLAAFQQISGSAIRRVQSTFSGPNQFGIWLLIPLSILATRIFQSKKFKKHESRILMMFGVCLIVALMLTFSRSAWIGAFVIAAVVGSKHLPRRVFRDALIGIVSILAIAGVAASLIAPSVFLRATSTREHIVRPLKAIHEMIRYPLGMGLGAAGPAANRTHEPCVFLEPGNDPSWAKNAPTLCVFVGQTQVQPANHHCDCALLPESWYLQVGVEMGVLGFLLYICLVGVVLSRLAVKSDPSSGSGLKVKNGETRTFHFSFFTFLFFLGISIAALFLHAWEDAAVAYTAWVFVASNFSKSSSV